MRDAKIKSLMSEVVNHCNALLAILFTAKGRSDLIHMASDLLRQAVGEDSLRFKRKLAVGDSEYLAALVRGG